jgi:hypothetical protein
MGAKDFEIVKRDTSSIVVTVQNSDETPIDITGYTFFFTAKTNATDTDDNAVIKKDVTSHSDPTNGQTTITLSATDTDVDPARLWYDIQMKDTSSNITTLLMGFVTIVQDITVRTS